MSNNNTNRQASNDTNASLEDVMAAIAEQRAAQEKQILAIAAKIEALNQRQYQDSEVVQSLIETIELVKKNTVQEADAPKANAETATPAPGEKVETTTTVETKIVKPRKWLRRGLIGTAIVAIGAGAYYAADTYTDWLPA